jgi:tetratricopeptide (TPR) repeat protein
MTKMKNDTVIAEIVEEIIPTGKNDKMDHEAIKKLTQQALRQDNAGDYSLMIETCDKILQFKPEMPETIYYFKGCGHMKLGAHDKAIEAFQQAINNKWDYAAAHNNLGICHYNLGEFEAATNAFQATISNNPDMAKAHFNLGNAYRELGDILKAAESYKQTTIVNPNYAKAYYNAVECWSELGDTESALRELMLLSSIDEEMANKLLRKVFPDHNGSITGSKKIRSNPFHTVFHKIKNVFRRKSDEKSNQILNNIGIISSSTSSDLVMSLQIDDIPIFFFKIQASLQIVIATRSEYMESHLRPEELSLLQQGSTINGLLAIGRIIIENDGSFSAHGTIDTLALLVQKASEKMMLTIESYPHWQSFSQFLKKSIENDSPNMQLPFDYCWLIGNIEEGKSVHACRICNEGNGVFVDPETHYLPIFTNSFFAEISIHKYQKKYGLSLASSQIDCLGCFLAGFSKDAGSGIIKKAILNDQWKIDFYTCEHVQCKNRMHYYLRDRNVEFALIGCKDNNKFPIWCGTNWVEEDGLELFDTSDLATW